MTKASEYHKQGYTCGEAIIKAFNEENNTDIPVAIGSSMGTGFSAGSLCGAVGGAAAVIGYLKGRESNEEANSARGFTKELMSEVREKFRSEICLDLKKNKVSCSDIIDHTYKTLNELIKE
ncbi:MAG: C-GCAxxG-C-C family (seleno)protein [Clostridiaceae bacterium]